MQNFLMIVGIVVAMLVGDAIANNGKITNTVLGALERLMPN